MKPIISYDGFKAVKNKSPELHRISMFSTMPMDEKQHVENAIHELFNYYENADKFLHELMPRTSPILLWDRDTLLDKYGITDAVEHGIFSHVYNSPLGIIRSKLDLLRLLKKGEFIDMPTTVFSQDDVKSNLNFPLIAKASNTFQSRGVEKINNRRQLLKLPKGFDIYQNQIEIAEEYRCVFFSGKQGLQLIAVFLRIPANSKAKDLRVDEGMRHSRLLDRKKSDFTWVQINPNKSDKFNVDEACRISQFPLGYSPSLNISGVDLAVDTLGKMWFIEVNSTPGLFSNIVPLMYKYIYEDVYGPLSNNGMRRIRDFSYYFAHLTELDEPDFRVDDPDTLSILQPYNK